MEQGKHFPIRYILGAILLLVAFGVLLTNEFMAFLLSLGCLIAAALCFLPPSRKGLWFGGAAVIVLHFFMQQDRPGMLLDLLLDPPDGSTEPGLLYVLYGLGAFVCFIYLCAIIASCLDSERPISPKKTLTKVLIVVSWIVFIASCSFEFFYLIQDWRPSIGYLPSVVYIIYLWGQYALIHWLFFVTIAWIWSSLRKKKAEA